MQTNLAKKHERSKMALTVAFAVICIVYVLPILIVLMNSFKSNAAVNTETFALPNENSFVGLQNYIKGMTFGNYPFIKAVLYSLFITLASSALILLCTSMAAWYVSRVGSLVSKIIYYLCVFSMVVPFQMVMFTLSRTAEQVKLPYFSFTSMAFAKIGLNTPWTIPIVYLGFGAGLAVFMFSGFVKTIPLEIEEAAVIDGCGPLRTFFLVVLPMMKPTFISVGVLEIMWVWNDFLLPYLYSEFMKAALENTSYFRPLGFDFPADPDAREVQDQLLLGEGVMVAPVYTQNASGRHVYLPESMKLYRVRSVDDYDTELLPAGHHYVRCALDEVLLFIRPGHAVPVARPASCTAQLDETGLTLWACPDESGSARCRMYTDDGETSDFAAPEHWKVLGSN